MERVRRRPHVYIEVGGWAIRGRGKSPYGSESVAKPERDPQKLDQEQPSPNRPTELHELVHLNEINCRDVCKLDIKHSYSTVRTLQRDYSSYLLLLILQP